jgi:hypothetical protein|tara:strand:+ start:2404 stop:2586 length:183 start_codon:yes stop_codon:yes gene_type:complete
MVVRLNPEQFIKTYNAACNRLGLEEGNRAIDWDTYSRVNGKLVRESQVLKDVLRRKGFDV